MSWLRNEPQTFMQKYLADRKERERKQEELRKATGTALHSKPLKRVHETIIEEKSQSDSASIGKFQVKRPRKATLFDDCDESSKNSKETCCFPQQKEEKLVAFFVKNQCFYNKSDVKYANKTYRTKLLQALAAELHTTEKQILGWWKKKRTKVGELIKKKSVQPNVLLTARQKWTLSKLGFLKNFIIPREGASYENNHNEKQCPRKSTLVSKYDHSSCSPVTSMETRDERKLLGEQFMSRIQKVPADDWDHFQIATMKFLQTYASPYSSCQNKDSQRTNLSDSNDKVTTTICDGSISTPKDRKVIVHNNAMLFSHPFSMIISGPSQSGKTTLVERIIKTKNTMVKPQIAKITWFYGSESSITKLRDTYPDIKFCSGLPNINEIEKFDSDVNRLMIIDDLMCEKDSEGVLVDLFTKSSHHRNISVIFIVHNVFEKYLRTVNINAKYMIMFKNPRDQSQIRVLGTQMFGSGDNLVKKAYADISKEPHAYLLLNFSQDAKPCERVRTKIFPYEENIFYIKEGIECWKDMDESKALTCVEL